VVTFLTIGERQLLGAYADERDQSISGACHELISRNLATGTTKK